jgi:transcriptional regulator with XRE-family HTH domain
MNLELVRLVGQEIKLARKKRRWSGKELAERAGIAIATLQKIERGDPTSSIGLVFEVAILVGLQLFDTDTDDLKMRQGRVESSLALLPKHTHAPKRVVDDDF